MKKIFIIVMAISIISGCDYFESSVFTVVNETSKTIVIKTLINPNDNGMRFRDSTYSIPKGTAIKFHQDRGMTGRNVVPPDYYDPLEAVPPVSRFDILIDNKLYDTLRLRQFWSFSSRKQVGTYTLTINQELLDRL